MFLNIFLKYFASYQQCYEAITSREDPDVPSPSSDQQADSKASHAYLITNKARLPVACLDLGVLKVFMMLDSPDKNVKEPIKI